MFQHQIILKLAIGMTVLIAGLSFNAQAKEPMPVVATFSILGDMVARIGGDAVAVSTLVGRNGDTHVYQPTPADAMAVKKADLLITNGLEFEGWLERLAEAAAFDGVTVAATDGIDLIASEHHAHDHGEYDPHGWLSLRNAMVYIDNITAALAVAAPEQASTFYENRAAYAKEIQALDEKIQSMFNALAESNRTIITSHDAFQYFGRDYGLTFLAPQGLSTDSEASARDVANLIKQIRAEGIAAVFVENVADPRLIKQIASETDNTVGGELFPGALSDSDGPASTYLDLISHNATTIAKALTK